MIKSRDHVRYDGWHLKTYHGRDQLCHGALSATEQPRLPILRYFQETQKFENYVQHVLSPFPLFLLVQYNDLRLIYHWAFHSHTVSCTNFVAAPSIRSWRIIGMSSFRLISMAVGYWRWMLKMDPCNHLALSKTRSVQVFLIEKTSDDWSASSSHITTKSMYVPEFYMVWNVQLIE